LTGDARQAALGGKALTIADYDPATAIFNPASISTEMNNQLQVNYINYLADLNYGTISYARTMGETTGTFHGGVTYLNYGTFEGYDERGQRTSDFTASEAAVSFGYAIELLPELSAGLNVKFITSRLEQYSSIGGAADIGLLFRPAEKKYRLALTLRNMGTQFTTYNEVEEPLPFQIALGYSTQVKTLPLRLHLTLDNLQQWDLSYVNEAEGETDLEGNVTADEPGFFNNALRHLIIGAELFPESAFNLRFGYNFRRGEELAIQDVRSFAGLSAGVGIKFNRVRVSYTHVRYSLASNSSFFGVNIDLN
jgi:hypothetical protein